MGRRQRRRAQTDADILIINKINLRPSAYSASSASGNVNLTHLQWKITNQTLYVPEIVLPPSPVQLV